MPDGGERKAFLTADYNAEMIEHIARYPRIRDGAAFVGEADDIVTGDFGPGLPDMRGCRPFSATIGRPTSSLPVAADGARRAAALISQLL